MPGSKYFPALFSLHEIVSMLHREGELSAREREGELVEGRREYLV